MGVKVSVVVPVYNPGSGLDLCLESLLDQSLEPGDYEVLFVDDGSDDGTPERLASLAERHQHVRLIHAARTGGPGRPRNIGIEVAHGEYLYFVDQDDALTRSALERMYATAIRTSADVVVGKIVGSGRQSVGQNPFQESRDDADLLSDHLLDLLTPHKLFRTAFLLQHRLRFPEGPSGLADERFAVRAYFLASCVSVVADEVCCHRNRSSGRARRPVRRFDPAEHCRSLRTVLDLVDAHTVPGDERDEMYAHWYDTAMLRLVGGRPLLGRQSQPRRPSRQGGQALHREVRRLASDRFGPGVERYLAPPMRVRARLLHADACTDLVRLAEAERGLTVVPTLERVEWDDEHHLEVRVSGRLTYADGRPVRVRRDDGRLLWEPPVASRAKLPVETYDVTRVIEESRLDVYAQNREDAGDYRLPTRSQLAIEAIDDSGQIVLHGTAALDVRTAKLGRPLEAGIWDLYVRAECCGWTPQGRISRPSLYQTTPPAAPRTVGASGGAVVEPYWTAVGNLSIRVERAEAGAAASGVTPT